jgi:hypothetical protein
LVGMLIIVAGGLLVFSKVSYKKQDKKMWNTPALQPNIHAPHRACLIYL